MPRAGATSFLRANAPLLAIIVVGAVLRLAYLMEARRAPDFTSPAADAAFHDYWARGIVSGQWAPPAGESDPQIDRTPFLRPPGYPYFLALAYALTGSSYTGARAIQMVLGLANVVLAFVVARSLYGRRAGLIAAALMSVNWSLIYFEGEFQDNVLLVTLSLVLALALVRWHEKPNAWRAFAVGVLVGLTALVRPNVLAFLPVLVAWLYWVLRRQRRVQALPLAAGAVLAGAALLIAPATIRNAVASGDPVLISCNGAVNLYIGNNPESDPVSPRIPELASIAGSGRWNWFSYGDLVRGVSRHEGREMSYSDVDRYFAAKALDYILAHPARALGLAAQRTLLMLGPAEVSNNKVDHYERVHSRVLRFLPGFPVALALGLVGCAAFCADLRSRAPVKRRGARPAAAKGDERAAGAASAARAAASAAHSASNAPRPVASASHANEVAARRIEVTAFLILFAAVFIASYAPFLAAGRFRVPAIPFLVLLGALGVDRIWETVRARRLRDAAIWSGLLLAFVVLTHIPFVRYEPDLAWWRYDRGTAYARRGDHAAAAAEYRKAIEAKPDFVDALVNLGGSLARQGSVDEGLVFYRRALEIDPGNAEVRMKLGGLLAEHGRGSEAASEYERVLDAAPGSAEAHFSVGLARGAEGKTAEAIAAYREAVRLKPDYVQAHVNLGLELARSGRIDEAIASYQTALRLAPNSAEAHNNFGAALAAQGKLDDAAAEYRRAIDLDAKYAKPHENLGRVLKAQNRLNEAIEEYRLYLALEPRDAKARVDFGANLGRAGKTDEAIAQFREALTIEPDNFAGRFNLANAYAAQGEIAKAVEEMRHAVRVNPENATAKAQLAALETKLRSSN